ncbi:MAG: three-Cys-motif partner protein TcmP [Bacteroidales bacterium]|nr:three-Cys-motif partner protein TcmP [Bacteroidales bacterium]
MAKNINVKPFDEATRLKLNIFGECFEEWLPVFNNDLYTKKVYIFDFFAGSGTDKDNNQGSPLILLEKAKGKDRKYCLNAKKETAFIFNESLKDKSIELKQNLKEHIKECKIKNNCNDCVYDYTVLNYEFKNVFRDSRIKGILEDKDFGKFVLLDQYGFKEIDESIFKQLISFPKTDFIFFISSSFINRFKEHQNTRKYIDTSKISFEDRKPNEIHRAVADYFRDLIPIEKEYYLHHFSIRKEANKGNYYGLIFGSNHTLGMEKFLKVCWRNDEFSGEANYNIDVNYEQGSLFYDPKNPVKKENVKKKIEDQILQEKIRDNTTGLKYAMNEGCEPKLFTEVVQEMEKQRIIIRVGNVNNSSTNIHRAKIYQIKIVNNGNKN